MRGSSDPQMAMLDATVFTKNRDRLLEPPTQPGMVQDDHRRLQHPANHRPRHPTRLTDQGRDGHHHRIGAVSDNRPDSDNPNNQTREPTRAPAPVTTQLSAAC